MVIDEGPFEKDPQGLIVPSRSPSPKRVKKEVGENYDVSDIDS
jgi:hypothetical protein